ncbi:MAG: phosphate acyltransferase [Clostridiales bacterium GWC2_40_7]|nr:MAG: phosphate acyltransferase [Clostridiales bacterium GWC2_40_7]
MRILVDAMGGDNAPGAIVNGSIDAIKTQEGFEVVLIGDVERINAILTERKFSSPRLQVIHAQEIITNEDLPTKAIKSKKNSSMVVGFNMLKEKKGDVFMSAGNSGALLTGALLILGRLKGVDRPALGAVIPTKKGKCLIIDAGLNSVCKPVNYVQFGIFGTAYMKGLLNMENPTVGLVNMGTEAKKGTEVLKQAYTMLSESKLNFIGNIEGKDVMLGNVQVAVCDGYVGNVMLKFLEGAGSFFGAFLKGMFKRTIFSKLSMLFVAKDMLAFKKMLDPSVEGGAPILGVNGLVIKSHGNSDGKTIKNVIIKSYNLANSSAFEQIKDSISSMEVKDVEKRERKRWNFRRGKLRTKKNTD